MGGYRTVESSGLESYWKVLFGVRCLDRFLIIVRSPEIDLCSTRFGLTEALVRDRSPQTVSGPRCGPPNLYGACLVEWKLSQVPTLLG